MRKKRDNQKRRIKNEGKQKEKGEQNKAHYTECKMEIYRDESMKLFWGKTEGRKKRSKREWYEQRDKQLEIRNKLTSCHNVFT